MPYIQRIFKLMKDTSTTAAQLTREVPLTNGVITQWKQGKQKPSLDAIIKLAQYFHVSTDYLLGLTDNPQPIINKNVEENEKMEEKRIPRFAASPFNLKLKALRKEKQLSVKKLCEQLGININIYEEMENSFERLSSRVSEMITVYHGDSEIINKLKDFYVDDENFEQHEEPYLEDCEYQSDLSDKIKGRIDALKINICTIAFSLELEEISIISWVSGERTPNSYWKNRLSNYLQLELTELKEQAATSPQDKEKLA